MSLCQVLQIYTNYHEGVWSSEKPALCFRGHKHMHAVIIDFPVKVVRRPVKDFDALAKTTHHGAPYPVDKMVKHLRTAGRHNGITIAAKKLLETVADGKATFPIDEEELHLTEEDDTMETPETTGTTTQAEDAGSTTQETKVTKKTKAPKAAKKKQTKPIKPAKTKPVKPAKTKSAAAPKPRGEGVGTHIRELIKDGKTTEQILAAVKKKFPDSEAKASSVAWHRCQMKKK